MYSYGVAVMKNFALIFLMCFSLCLEGSKFTPIAPSRQQATSALAQIKTAQNDIAAYSEALSGLLDQFETTLCGATSGLSLTPGGSLSISSSSGNYTNCNGGDIAFYNSVETEITGWIATLNNVNYHTGSADCTNAATGILTASQQAYASMQQISNDMTNIVNLMGQPGTYGQVSVTPSGQVVAYGPGVITVNGLGDAISSTLQSISAYLNAQAVLDASAALNAVIAKEDSAFDAYSACYNKASHAGTPYSNLNLSSYTCNGGSCLTNGTYWCPQIFLQYLISWEAVFPFYKALYVLLAKYQPTDIANATLTPVSSDTVKYFYPTIASDPAMLSQSPAICTAAGCNINSMSIGNYGDATCTAATTTCGNMPSSCMGTLNGYVCGIVDDLTEINNLSTNTSSEFANTKIRVQALNNMLTTVAGNVKNSLSQLGSVVNNCKIDISKQQAYLKAIEMGISMGLGLLTNILVFTGIGALGIPMLSEVLTIVTAVPAINNYTLGKITGLEAATVINGLVVPTQPQ